MADYHRSFSSFIMTITAAERAWLTAHLEGDSDVASLWAELGIETPEDYCDDFPDFEWSFEVGKDSSTDLWLGAGDSFDFSHVGWLVQAFLRRFRPRDAFSMQWGDTCSAPRPEGFGGGALFVTATGVADFHTADWVAERHRAHDAMVAQASNAGEVPPNTRSSGTP